MTLARRHVGVLLLLLILQVTGICTAISCPSCYGAEDSAATEGMNLAILSLLGVTSSVLVSVVAFFLYLRNRALRLNRRFTNMMN
jgi:hypothetical protein